MLHKLSHTRTAVNSVSTGGKGLFAIVKNKPHHDVPSIFLKKGNLTSTSTTFVNGNFATFFID